MYRNLIHDKGERPPWWFTDERGRRIGWMWPEDLKRDIDSLWGVRKGIGGLSEYIGCARATVEQYCNGKVPVPKQTALLVQSLIMLVPKWNDKKAKKRYQRHFPKLEAPWLPREEDKQDIGIARYPFG